MSVMNIVVNNLVYFIRNNLYSLFEKESIMKHCIIFIISFLFVLSKCSSILNAGDLQNQQYVSSKAPPIDGMTEVRRDVNGKLPAYIVVDDGVEYKVPFTPTTNFPPEGYKGDFYVDEFTDAKIRELWKVYSSKGTAFAKEGLDAAKSRGLRNEFRVTGTVDKFGKIDPNSEVELSQIRRPKYFGSKPYAENIAKLDTKSYVVEVEVPASLNEIQFMGAPEGSTHKLRGWYIKGSGVEDASGKKVHVLVVIVSGRTIEITAIQSPYDKLYDYNMVTKKYEQIKYPNATTEQYGIRQWRDYHYQLVKAGFDVLNLDKRGHGISGGYNASNTVQQARDIFRALDAFASGKKLRVQTADGKTLTGKAASEALWDGKNDAKEFPIFLAGTSQGSLVVGHAMHLNFVADTDFDLPVPEERKPFRYNIKGGILLAEFVKGPGYTSSSRLMVEAALRGYYHVAYINSGEIMRDIDKWPAVFIARGLWCFSGSLEGTLDLYQRVKGLKELVVLRGPHSENEFGAENIKFLQERIINFCKDVMRGAKSISGAAEFNNLRELVESSPAHWEASMDPNLPFPLP